MILQYVPKKTPDSTEPGVLKYLKIGQVVLVTNEATSPACSNFPHRRQQRIGTAGIL